MWYTIALFVHITGAMLLFIGMGVEWLGLNRLRRAARVEQVREISHLLRVLAALFPLSTLLILGGGLYMAITVWGFAIAWLDAALVVVVTLFVTGSAVSGPRMGAIAKAASNLPEGPLPDHLQRQTTDPILLFFSRMTTLLGWGIIFLMTVKPALLGSLITLGVSVALGILLALLAQRAIPKQSLERAQTGDDHQIYELTRR